MKGMRTLKNAHLVVEAGGDEGIQNLAAAFDDDTLELTLVEFVQEGRNVGTVKVEPVGRDICQAVPTVEDDGLRLVAVPMAGGELRTVVEIGLGTHEDGGFFCSPTVVEAVLPGGGEPIGTAVSRR